MADIRTLGGAAAGVTAGLGSLNTLAELIERQKRQAFSEQMATKEFGLKEKHYAGEADIREREMKVRETKAAEEKAEYEKGHALIDVKTRLLQQGDSPEAAESRIQWGKKHGFGTTDAEGKYWLEQRQVQEAFTAHANDRPAAIEAEKFNEKAAAKKAGESMQALFEAQDKGADPEKMQKLAAQHSQDQEKYETLHTATTRMEAEHQARLAKETAVPGVAGAAIRGEYSLQTETMKEKAAKELQATKSKTAIDIATIAATSRLRAAQMKIQASNALAAKRIDQAQMESLGMDEKTGNFYFFDKKAKAPSVVIVKPDRTVANMDKSMVRSWLKEKMPQLVKDEPPTSDIPALGKAGTVKPTSAQEDRINAILQKLIE